MRILLLNRLNIIYRENFW